MMGSPTSEAKRGSNETQHSVTLTKGFWLLETQVTQGMWESVMGSNPSYFRGSKKLPVEQVSWDDCQVFIQKLNGMNVVPTGYCFSLPTEAQWEYACRAGTTTPYHWGDTLNGDKANCNGNTTTEVGSYPANAWGLHDMHGNVHEWCAEGLWVNFNDYPKGALVDPISPWGINYVLRGGCCSSAKGCRSASRLGNPPSARSSYEGIRLCLVSQTVEEQAAKEKCEKQERYERLCKEKENASTEEDWQRLAEQFWAVSVCEGANEMANECVRQRLALIEKRDPQLAIIREKVIKIIADQLGREPQTISDSMDIDNDLGMSKLVLTCPPWCPPENAWLKGSFEVGEFEELLLAVQEEFSIDIDDSESHNLVTVGDVIGIIHAKVTKDWEEKQKRELQERYRREAEWASIRERVIKVIARQFGRNPQTISDATKFVDDLGANEHEGKNLLHELRVEFSIHIDDSEIYNVVTVGDAVRRIHAKVTERQRTGGQHQHKPLWKRLLGW
jgi:acyl carrier protein